MAEEEGYSGEGFLRECSLKCTQAAVACMLVPGLQLANPCHRPALSEDWHIESTDPHFKNLETLTTLNGKASISSLLV